MLDFQLGAEQQMLADVSQRFAEEQIRPAFRQAEESALLPAAVVHAGRDLGLLAASIPEEFGGLGDYSVVNSALAVEQLAWGDLAIALAIMAENLVAIPLMLAGTAAQQATYLPRFAENDQPVVTAALTEPIIQFDPHRPSTTATAAGSDYVLTGCKAFVPLAAEAELFLIFAWEGDATQAFLAPAGAPGLEIHGRDRVMGLNALPLYSLELNACRLPGASQLGGPQGIDFQLLLDHFYVAQAAAAVGVARASYEYALDYARQRVQFGEPIAHRQSIAFMLAEMATDVDEMRLLAWEVAWLLDQQRPASREALLMKRHVDRTVLRVADRAVQILGGYGYIREYPVELWLRNARGFAAFHALAII